MEPLVALHKECGEKVPDIYPQKHNTVHPAFKLMSQNEFDPKKVKKEVEEEPYKLSEKIPEAKRFISA